MALQNNVQAATPTPSKAGTHRMWFGFYFGPAIGVGASEFKRTIFGLEGTVDYYPPNQIKLVETFGSHLSDSADGLAVALDIQESFGGSQVILQFVPRVLWDFLIVDKLALFLTPSFGLGYIYLSQDKETMEGGTAHGITFQLSLDTKLSLSDLFYVFLRPVGIEIQPVSLVVGALQDWGTFVRTETLFGGGIIF